MTIKTKEYYKKLDEQSLKDIRYVDHCARMAEKYKDLYEKTKNSKRFMDRFIARSAKRLNTQFVNMGFKVSQKRLGILSSEYQKLSEYIDGFEKADDKEGLG